MQRDIKTSGPVILQILIAVSLLVFAVYLALDKTPQANSCNLKGSLFAEAVQSYNAESYLSARGLALAALEAGTLEMDLLRILNPPEKKGILPPVPTWIYVVSTIRAAIYWFLPLLLGLLVLSMLLIGAFKKYSLPTKLPLQTHRILLTCSLLITLSASALSLTLQFVQTKKAVTVYVTPAADSQKIGTVEAAVVIRSLATNETFSLVSGQGLEGWVLSEKLQPITALAMDCD